MVGRSIGNILLENPPVFYLHFLYHSGITPRLVPVHGILERAPNLVSSPSGKNRLGFITSVQHLLILSDAEKCVF